MRQLKELEARVNDAPDSVLAVLTADDMPRWGEARALYALLTVEAQDKSYIDVADDSLIRVATRYYDRRGPALHRLQAFYYHGRVYANAGLRHEAMAAYTRAKNFVDEVDAPYPVGLLYLQMGVLDGNDYDYSQGLAYMEEALKYYKEADKERLQFLTKRNIGQFCYNMNSFSQADSLLNEVLAWGEAHNDTYLIYSTLDLLLRLYDTTENIAALDALLNKYPIEAILPNATTYCIIAHYYAQTDDKASAESALTRAWNVAATAQDTAMLWQKSYQINKALGYTDAALRDYEHLFALQDSIVRITLQQPLIASQLEHYRTRLEVEELRNLNYRYVIEITALVLLLVAILLYLHIRRYLRDKDKQLMQQIELADELRLTIYNKEENLDKMFDELHAQRLTFNTKLQAMNQQISELFRARYNLLDELCTTYYENPKDELRRGHIFEQVCDTINFFSSNKGYASLEAVVNDGCNDVIVRLRSEFPKFKEKDYRLLCYFCAGFSIQAICLFTQENPNKLWVYKSRLIARIKSSNAPSKDTILAQIPQRIR